MVNSPSKTIERVIMTYQQSSPRFMKKANRRNKLNPNFFSHDISHTRLMNLKSSFRKENDQNQSFSKHYNLAHKKVDRNL